jgi:hypothetical protein
VGVLRARATQPQRLAAFRQGDGQPGFNKKPRKTMAPFLCLAPRVKRFPVSLVADIASIHANSQAAIPEHPAKIDPAFANCDLVGSLWIDANQTPLRAGLDLGANSATGSNALASSTRKSFVQGIGTDCLAGHIPQPFPIRRVPGGERNN